MFFIGLAGLILITEIYMKDYDNIINYKVKYAYLPIKGITFFYDNQRANVLKDLDVSKEIDKITENISERKLQIDNPKTRPIRSC